MRAALAIFLIIALLLPVTGAAAMASIRPASQPVPLQEYWSRVAQTRQIISGLQGSADSVIRAELDKLAGQWEALKQVQLPDGSILPVDNREMAALLRHDPPDLACSMARLDALLAAHQGEPSFQKNLGTLAKILAGPRFQWPEAKPSNMPQWWTDFWNRLQEWFDSLFGNSSGATAVIPGLQNILTGVLAVLLAGILAYAGRGLFSSLVGEAELVQGWDGEEESLTSAIALQRAETLSGEGNYRSAVRYLYLSSLLLLDERGLLHYDRYRTNREYLRSLSAAPALAGPLRAMIDIFDRVWYGFENIDRATYMEYLAQVGELRKQKP